MEKFFDRLGEILSADPGGRGLLGQLPRQNPSAAVRLISSANKTFIVTGFPIASAGVGENDGPVGAASLAYALCRAGRQAYIVTDSWSERIVKACLKALGCAAPVICLERGGPGEISSIASRLRPDLIVTIERPGKGRDGHFHNMRGQVIDDMVADTDAFLTCGLPVISIGDGGNELGMGNFYDIIASHVSCGSVIAAAGRCDVPLAAGISNWWGWGLAAAIGAVTGDMGCMTDGQQEYMSLRAAMEAGGVDGVRGLPEMSADGIELGGIDTIHRRLRQALEDFLAGRQY